MQVRQEVEHLGGRRGQGAHRHDVMSARSPPPGEDGADDEAVADVVGELGQERKPADAREAAPHQPEIQSGDGGSCQPSGCRGAPGRERGGQDQRPAQ